METRVNYIFDTNSFDKSTTQLNTARTAVENAIRGRALVGNEVIIDTWSRTGKLACLLSQKVPEGRVIGFDPSSEMIEFAQKNCPENVTFIQKELTEQLDEVQERADMVISSWYVPFVAHEKQITYAANLLKLLKPEGRLIVLFPLPGSKLGEAINQTLKHDIWVTKFRNAEIHRATFSSDQYANLLQTNGFNQVEVDERRVRHVFHGEHELTHYITTAVSRYLPYLKGDDVLKSVFIADIAREYLNLVKHSATNIPYETVMLCATARRPALVNNLQAAGVRTVYANPFVRVINPSTDEKNPYSDSCRKGGHG